jgi:integrase
MSARVIWRRNKWAVRTDHKGKQTLKFYGSTQAKKAEAERAAEKVNAFIAAERAGFKITTQENPEPTPSAAPEKEAVPFDRFALDWLRREVELPVERHADDALAPNTARCYASNTRVHLIPYFGERDLREIDAEAVQAFYNHCIDRNRPKSKRSIEVVILTLGLILKHARAAKHVQSNAVTDWKQERAGIGRRRSRKGRNVITRKQVLDSNELSLVLDAFKQYEPAWYPLFLFLADTGARQGEAAALRWADVVLERGTAQIGRSFSSGLYLGETKTGHSRTVELSDRLLRVLRELEPDICGAEALVFPSENGSHLDPANVRRALGRVIQDSGCARRTSPRLRDRRVKLPSKRITPHSFRHTFASLHLARGTPITWVQEQGGWTSPAVLLDTYTHFVPHELAGFANTLAAGSDGTRRDQRIRRGIVTSIAG